MKVTSVPKCRACGATPKIARTKTLYYGRVQYGEWYATCNRRSCWAWTHVWAKSRKQAEKRWATIHGR